MKSPKKRLSDALIFVAIIFSTNAHAVAPKAVIADGGMVASRSAWASQVGAQILDQGGNAIDAVVAVGFALAVTYPSAGNLAGGGFMVIHLNDGTVITNDHREKAPAASTKDMFLDSEGEVVKGLSTKSHLAVGVPGSVAGLLSALEKYGTMSRAQVLQPAIDLAADGILLDRDLAEAFASRAPDFAPYAASRAVFSNEGVLYEIGDRWIQSDLAQTLIRIRDKGRDGFYKGRTADLLVAEMESGNGLISHDDLEDYQPRWREAIRGTYKGYEIISMPPPSSGGILLVQMLNMLENYDLNAAGYGSSEAIHHMIVAEPRA